MLDSACDDKQPTKHPITVTLPNGDQIQSTHEATLRFDNVPQGALRAHLFPDLRGQALLSIGVFCDAGCTASFTDTTVLIHYKGQLVLEGARQPPGLWTTNLNVRPATAKRNQISARGMFQPNHGNMDKSY
jgi:hypothetical protein